MNNKQNISQTTVHLLAITTLAFFSQHAWAHSGNSNKVAWEVCNAKEVSDQCTFQNSVNDVYRGACQLMSDELLCVRNQPIEKNVAAATNDAASSTEADQFHNIEHLFSGADIVAGPSLVDCTLSGGTSTRCFTVSVKAEPLNYTPGPWCPESINDGPDLGGIWLEDGHVNDVDGAFIENLASFYDDTNWQLFDATTGKINVTDSPESCAAAARPNVDPEYQNHCVQCLPEYMSDDAAVTYVIPLIPVLLSGSTGGTRQSGSGIAFNGIRLDGPAPVDAILSAYTVAPFDDCGGHVNLNVGYHYHAATDCLLQNGQANDHGTIVGLAMDGHSIYSHLTTAGDAYTDLDSCGGHPLSDNDYHYHAGKPGSNAILSCFTAEVGCASQGTDSSCDASLSENSGGKGGNNGGGGNRPDFSAIAKTLGVSESALMEALGGPPPNIDNAAKVLNIDIDVLRSILPRR